MKNKLENLIFGLLVIVLVFIGLCFCSYFYCGYSHWMSKTESIIVNEVEPKEIKDNYKRDLLLETKYWQPTGMINRIFYRVNGYWIKIKYKDETKISLQKLLQDIEIVADLLGKETVTEDNYLQIKKSQNLLAVCRDIVNYALQNKCLLSKARVKFTEKLFEAWKELAEERQHFKKAVVSYRPVMLVDGKIYRARGFDDKLLLTILHKYKKDNVFTYEFVLENNTDKLIKVAPSCFTLKKIYGKEVKFLAREKDNVLTKFIQTGEQGRITLSFEVPMQELISGVEYYWDDGVDKNNVWMVFESYDYSNWERGSRK